MNGAVKLELVAFALSMQALGGAGAQMVAPQMVGAGGYRVRMLVEGQGSPAVVFVAGGFGAPLESWGEVRVKTSRFIRRYSGEGRPCARWHQEWIRS